MATVHIHDALKPISWLIGRWVGNNGVGIFPTIKTFNYDEEIEFTAPAAHQPVLHVKSTSWLITDDKKKIIAHCEYGFLKVRPNTNPPVICYTSTQNTSISTVEEGTYDDSNKVISLDTKSIARSETNKPPEVTKIKRELKLEGEKLCIKMLMATSTTSDVNEHLRIELQRA